MYASVICLAVADVALLAIVLIVVKKGRVASNVSN